MNKRLTALLCAAAAATSCVGAVPAAADSGEPVLSINFDEDNSGYVLNGGAALSDGKSGKGLVLDGVDSYALLPENLLSDSMTVSAWVRQDKKNVWGRLFDFGEDSANNFFFAPCSGGASRAEAKSPSGVDTLDSVEFAEKGVWAYYTVTADKNAIRIYRDGRLISEKTDLSVNLSGIKNTLNYIGKSHYDGDAYFAGAVDDLKIYSRVLAPDEITADMAESINESDAAELIAVYSSGVSDGQLLLGDRTELPAAQIGNMRVFWSSSDEGVINSSTGAVTPADAASEITLTIHAASDSGAELAKNFTVRVPAKDTAPFTVTIDGSDRSRDVSDNMWGLFFEDINSAADGGLYAELVQNRSFEFTDGLFSWETVSGSAELSEESGLNENNPTYAVLSSKTGGAAISNDGFMGMSVKKDALYDFSLYVRGDYTGKIRAELVSGSGAALGLAELSGAVSDEWTKLSAVISSNANCADARLIVGTDTAGTLCVDMISLMPQDTYKGHGLRRDMMQALEAMHPKFLRFPGGCAVEGRTMDMAYNWKDTVGDVSERKNMENIWNPSASEYYDMTYGLGFYEYFVMCEDLGMEPVPILNCGMACQVRSGSSAAEEYLVPLDKLQPYIQDALDLIEFANGTDMSNEWVRLRADMGHPEPFNMKYIGIGNEQYGKDYFARYELFAKAIREAYPDMELNLVTTTGPASSGASNDLAWGWVNENNELADIVDEHYYEAADWFRSHAYRYDNYSRDTAKVFLGEYASKGNLWYNALSEAAFMTGLERNSDVVRMASYAPMFAKYGNTQWAAADMIWFNNDELVLTPNYYVQSLFSNNSGDYSLETEVKLNGIAEKSLSGGVAVGTWKTQAEFKDLSVVGNDGTLIFNDGFDSSKWERSNGEWKASADGSVEQVSDDEGAVYFAEGADWSDYTLSVKAKKTGGREGFLIGVCAQDPENMYWVNIGGWSNTATKFQKVTAGEASTITNTAEQDMISDFSVEDGVWYDIQVAVSGDSIKAYINGEPVASTTFKKSYGPVYASSVFDRDTGDIIIKAVNTADFDTVIHFDIDGVSCIEPNAEVTVMAGDTALSNSLENPDAIVPRGERITNASSSFDYQAKADSLSVIRIKTGTPGITVTSPSAGEVESIISGASVDVAASGSGEGYKVICVLYDDCGIMRGEAVGDGSVNVPTMGIPAGGCMRVYAYAGKSGILYCGEYPIVAAE